MIPTAIVQPREMAAQPAVMETRPARTPLRAGSSERATTSLPFHFGLDHGDDDTAQAAGRRAESGVDNGPAGHLGLADDGEGRACIEAIPQPTVIGLRAQSFVQLQF